MPQKATDRDLGKKIQRLQLKARQQTLAGKILKIRETAYRTLLEATSDLIWETDRQWVFQNISPNVRELLGYAPDEVQGKRLFDFMAPKDNLRMLKRFREIAGSQRAFQGFKSRLLHKDGRQLILEISGAPMIDRRGMLVGYQGTIRDITEFGNVEKIRSVFDDISRAVNSEIGLKQLFQKIHESLSRLIDTTNFFIAIFDAELHQIRFTYYTDQGDDIEAIDANDPGSITAEVIRTRKSLFLNETQLQQRYASKHRPIGNIAKVWLGVPMKIKGRVIGAVAVQSYNDSSCYTEEDIRLLEAVTEHIAIAIDRKQTEEALKESEEKYRDLVENINDVIFTTDTKGIFTYISPAVRAVLEYAPKEMIGQSLDRLVPPEDIQAVRDDFKKLLRGQNHVREYRLLTKSGEIRWVRISGKPVLKGGRFNGLRAIFSDITEARQPLSFVQQSERMEAIGILACGLAHDFNHILTDIQGRASLMLLDMHPDHLFYENLRSIEEHVKNAAGLTRQLTDLTKGDSFEIKPVDLNLILGKALDLFGRIHQKIEMQRQFQKELWNVEVDRLQIEHAFSVLLFNACQSMPDGGRITLGTGNELLDESSAKSYEIEPGPYVKVSIKDTSHGIPKEIRDKIFDPLFIAKGMGRETGFGLAMAHMIIQSYGGTIAVESEEDTGAEFRVYLPVREKKAGNGLRAMVLPDSHKGRETILLVEDEMEVMEVGVAMLEKLGYRVARAASAAEAIEIFRENLGNIDLVILAVLMSEMEGTEFFFRLKRSNPRVKIVLSSDYSDGELSKEELPVGHDGFIRKPFRMEELSKKIREILGPLA